MKTITLGISFLLVLLALVACKDVFYADDIISNEKIPVIQGIILEGQSPEVKLTWATNYEENGITYIRDATVRISDDLGNDELLEEIVDGVYVPVNSGFKGVRGRTYTLHVELPSGTIFESEPEKILPPADLDSIYAIPLERTIFEVNSTGSLIERDQKGLEVKTAIHRISDSVCYFRFRTDVLTEITYILNPNSLLPTDVFEWKSSILDNVFDVEYTYPLSAWQVVPEHNPGFLEFVYNPLLNSDASTAPYTHGWIVSMHVYSISANVYNYYNSIAQQLNGTNLIFAPVPSQIKNNISSVGEGNEKVIGVFEAGSEIIFYKGFSWVNDEVYYSVDLDFYPSGLGDGRTFNIPPDFWVRLH